METRIATYIFSVNLITLVYIPSLPEIKVHYSIFAGTGDYFVPRFKFYLLIYFLMQHAYYYEMQS